MAHCQEVRASHATKPRRVDAPVSHLDIAPAVLSLASIAPECRLDGRSLLPLLNGAPGEDRDFIFECGTHVGINFACGVQSWSENGRHDLYFYNASSDIDELYDLRHPDPVNLSGRPEHAAARQHMIERLGAVLAHDPRWLAYWSSFQLDQYFDLPRSLPGDTQLRVF